MESRNFLFISITAIVALSLFLRSMFDIGPDTGVYISIGKKIADGGRYYYDFLEGNFPLSFYLYALEYKISLLFNIDPIITSEIVINLLAILSIFYCSKILKNSTIYDNLAHYNLVLIAYLIGFFLRAEALFINEFGTKTSLLLICLFPYISFSFERRLPFSTKENAWRGILMGLIGCLKPHYLIIILFIELYKFSKVRQIKFFIGLDKLLMVAIGMLYLVLMLIFIPEFFEFMVPMWSEFYNSYEQSSRFLGNIFLLISSKIAIFSFIFLIFTRLKMSENNKILFLLFLAISTLLIIENLGTIDQRSVLVFVFILCFLKFGYDLILSQKLLFKDHKFLILSLMLIPAFDLKSLPWSFFHNIGFIILWWLSALLCMCLLMKKINNNKSDKFQNLIKKNNIKSLCFIYAILAAVTIVSYVKTSHLAFLSINLISLIIISFLFERFHAKFFDKFSSYCTFILTLSFSALFYMYIYSVIYLFNSAGSLYRSPNQVSESIAHYAKIYAPKVTDNILVFSTKIGHNFPVTNYLQKENPYPSHTLTDYGNGGVISDSYDESKLFLFYYFSDNLKKQILNKNTKLLFILNTHDNRVNFYDKACNIGYLEYYFLDPNLRKMFFENFEYKARILAINNEPKKTYKIGDIAQQEIYHDFEVYVRK